jgi:hypothetical protein
MNRSTARPATLRVLAGVLLAACASDPAGTQDPDDDDILFLVQTVVPDVVMDALFVGRVVVDPAGCVRLDSVDDATVVWPKAFALDARDGALRVLNAQQQEAGRIGGTFRLAGGEVPFLHGQSVSAADRARAATRCPGRYWMVASVQ